MKRTLQVIAVMLFVMTMLLMFSFSVDKINLSVYLDGNTTTAPDVTPDDEPYDPDNDSEMGDIDWGVIDDPTDTPTETPTVEPTDTASATDTVAPTPTSDPDHTAGATIAPTKTPKPTVKPSTATTPSYPETPGQFVKVGMEWFDDALFIGDSRTDGLRRYSGINNADFFCATGASVAAIMKNSYSVTGFGTTTLQNLLTKKTYGKIYISLGINEIGGSMNTIVGRYETLLKNVRALQPNAIIYIMANLHVTKARSDKNSYGVTNANLNTFNSRTAAFADGISTYYIDPNIIFDDENGALKSPDYSSATGDGAHIYAKCYVMWKDWLLTKGIAAAVTATAEPTKEPTKEPAAEATEQTTVIASATAGE